MVSSNYTQDYGSKKKKKKKKNGKKKPKTKHKSIECISSSSSSYRAGSTDIPGPLSPLLLIVHRPR